MLSRSQAKTFFIGSTGLMSAAFIWLTIDTFQKVPALTNQANMSASVIRGKHLWDQANCMGCHTLLGEGGYYAPELTKVYERRGAAFIRAMINDPQAMYPGQRKMYKYNFTDAEIEDFIAFFEWVGEMDLNGFPPKPVLFATAMPGKGTVTEESNRPKVYNQMCIACHSLAQQGGAVGPALDGIGDRMTMEEIEVWLQDPAAVRPGTAMPKLPLSEQDIRELAAFLSTLRGEPGPEGAPPPGSPDAETKGPDVPGPGDAGPGDAAPGDAPNEPSPDQAEERP